MDICSYDHDEICYEGRDCPLCIKLSEEKEQDQTITSLEKQIEDLQGEIYELKDEIKTYEEIQKMVIEIKE